jgi:hypothetical protein
VVEQSEMTVSVEAGMNLLATQALATCPAHVTGYLGMQLFTVMWEQVELLSVGMVITEPTARHLLCLPDSRP